MDALIERLQQSAAQRDQLIEQFEQTVNLYKQHFKLELCPRNEHQSERN